MRLILVRHGETEDNASNTVQGQTHGRLSLTGRSQAESVSLRLKDTKVDAIYTSDLDRARVTAKIIASRLPALVRTEDIRLREQDFGVFEGRPIVDLLEKMEGEKADFATFVPEKGESRVEFQKRIIHFFEEKRRLHAGETVLIVTHYGVINILLGWLLGHDDPLATDWRIGNGSVTILDIDQDGQGQPHIVNDSEHLEGLAQSGSEPLEIDS